MELSLFAKVCLLLFGSTFTTALGAYYGRLVRSMGGFIALIILFLAGAFAVFAAAHASAGLGIAVLYIWTFISGMLLSFSLEHYVETLGTKTVVFATGGTTLVMALCAIIGMFSGFNFGIIGPILSVVLIGLIGVGIVNIFVRAESGAK